MKIVFTNGTFDILHPGHIELFKVGASLGDKLIVPTDTDEKIRNDKGPSKPINDLCYRMSMLQSIRYIDTVHYFNSRKELEDLIEMYSPDILLLGGDWKNGDVVNRLCKGSSTFTKSRRIFFYKSHSNNFEKL